MVFLAIVALEYRGIVVILVQEFLDTLVYRVIQVAEYQDIQVLVYLVIVGLA